jgi:UDP-N-acetylglucosamine acyltransferase
MLNCISPFSQFEKQRKVYRFICVEKLSSKKYRLMAFLKGDVSVAKIHNLSEVDSRAVVAENVEIGAFCKVGPNVKIGAGCKLIGQCNVVGHTEIGENNIIFPFVSLGTEPHDISFKGWVSYLKIGNGNTFREGFTANVGADEGSTTVIENDCFFMANTHVGHNCHVGSRVILANGALMAGHSSLGDGCFIGGNSAVHQFVRIGRLVIMGGVSATSVDIPPFMIADGRNGPIRHINLIGLKRSGFSKEVMLALKHVHKIFFKSDLSVPQAIERIKEEVDMLPEVEEFIQFVENRGHRGIATGKTGNR